jgi:integrase
MSKRHQSSGPAARQWISKASILAGALRQSTLTQYQGAMKQFVTFLRAHGHFESFEVLINTDQIDCLLSDWLEDQFNSEKPSYNTVNFCFCGLIHFYPVLNQYSLLPASHALLKAWRRQGTPPDLAPMPRAAVLFVIRICLELGYHGEALALLVMSESWARSSNVLALRRSDVMLDVQRFFGPSVPPICLRLRQTKTGRNKTSWIRRPDVAFVLANSVGHLRPDDRLFPFTYAHLNRIFHIACSRAGLDFFSFTMHRIRAGCASAARLLGWRMEDICVEGSWASLPSAERYVNTNLLLLVMQSLPPNVLGLAALWEFDAVRLFTP